MFRHRTYRVHVNSVVLGLLLFFLFITGAAADNFSQILLQAFTQGMAGSKPVAPKQPTAPESPTQPLQPQQQQQQQQTQKEQKDIDLGPATDLSTPDPSFEEVLFSKPEPHTGRPPEEAEITPAASMEASADVSLTPSSPTPSLSPSSSTTSSSRGPDRAPSVPDIGPLLDSVFGRPTTAPSATTITTTSLTTTTSTSTKPTVTPSPSFSPPTVSIFPSPSIQQNEENVIQPSGSSSVQSSQSPSPSSLPEPKLTPRSVPRRGPRSKRNDDEDYGYDSNYGYDTNENIEQNSNTDTDNMNDSGAPESAVPSQELTSTPSLTLFPSPDDDNKTQDDWDPQASATAIPVEEDDWGPEASSSAVPVVTPTITVDGYPSNSSTTSTTTSGVGGVPAVRVNCGAHVDIGGFSNDSKPWSNPSSLIVRNVFARTRFRDPQDAALYSTYRFDDNLLRYTVPLATEGTWRVVLHWAEINAENMRVVGRVFAVKLADKIEDTYVDVFEQARGAFSPLSRTYVVDVSEPELVVEILKVVGRPMLSAFQATYIGPKDDAN